MILIQKVGSFHHFRFIFLILKSSNRNQYELVGDMSLIPKRHIVWNVYSMRNWIEKIIGYVKKNLI